MSGRLVVGVKGLAEELAVPERTIRHRLEHPDFPAYAPGGRRLLFDPDQVRQWVKAHPRKTRPAPIVLRRRRRAAS